VTQQLIDYFGIPREGDRRVMHSGEVQITLPQSVTEPLRVGAPIPDLRGMAKRQLLPLLRSEQIRVRLEGEGYVVGQDPPPGTTLAAGTTVVLKLE
jgi:cell division protein FtsI (penicillin-binding protein 3)